MELDFILLVQMVSLRRFKCITISLMCVYFCFSFMASGSGRRQIVLARKDLVAKSAFEDSETMQLTVKLSPETHPYVLIPCTFLPNQTTDFRLSVTADCNFTLEPVSANWRTLTISV